MMKIPQTDKLFYRYEARTYAVLGMDGDYESPKFPNPKIQLMTILFVQVLFQLFRTLLN